VTYNSGGTQLTVYSGTSASISSSTGGWYRFSVTATISDSTVATIGLQLDVTDTTGSVGSKILLDGALLEPTNTLKSYFSGQTTPTDVTTGLPQGYVSLVEPADVGNTLGAGWFGCVWSPGGYSNAAISVNRYGPVVGSVLPDAATGVGVLYDYYAPFGNVVYVAELNASPEGQTFTLASYTLTTNATTPVTTGWNLKPYGLSANNVYTANVLGPTQQKTQTSDVETVYPIGRVDSDGFARAVVVTGPPKGDTFDLTILSTTLGASQSVEALWSLLRPVWVESPFGEQWWVWITSASTVVSGTTVTPQYKTTLQCVEVAGVET